MKRSRSERRDFVLVSGVLVVVLAIAAGFRFYNLGAQSLWSDEGNSAALASRSLVQIAVDASHDIHPPLYYWLLHVWTQIVGTSEAALRSLSAALGVALVFGIAELGRRLYGPSTGLAAAFIAALAPFQVYYSQEARMYILLAVLATASFLHYWWFIEREEGVLPVQRGEEPARPWAWMPYPAAPLVVTWVAGLYTHYAFPIIIVAMSALYLTWAWATRRRGLLLKRVARWAVLLAVTAAFYVPWLPVALHQLRSWPTGGQGADAGTVITTALRTLSLGPASALPSGDWPARILVLLAALGAIPWRALITPFIHRSSGSKGQTAASADETGNAPTGAVAALAVAAAPLVSAVAVPALALPGAATLSLAPGYPEPQSDVEPRGASNPRPHLPGHDLPERARGRAWYWVRWLSPVLWLAAPIAMMLVLGLTRDAYLKFLLIASPAFVLLMARGVVGPANAIAVWGEAHPSGEGRPPLIRAQDIAGAAWITAVLSLVTIVSLPLLARYYTDPRLARDDYRGITRFIQATAQAGDAVLLDAPGQSEVFSYYFRSSELPVYALPRQRPLNRAATESDLKRLSTHNKIYALYWAAAEADPDGVIETWLDKSGYKTLDQWHGNVRLAVYVMPEREPAEETADNLDALLGGQIQLLGYRAWNLAPHAGEVTQLQLLWRAVQTPQRRYKVFVQLLDPRDQVIAQRDAEPAGESQPTSAWRPDEVVQDNHGLLIPPGTPPGTYRRIVGLYDPETLERLRLPTGEDHIDLPSVTVARSSTPPPLEALGMQYPQDFDFGGIRLLGYDQYKRGFRHAPDTPVHAGDRLHVTFYWQANVRPRADWWFDLTLSDNSGRLVAELQAPLVGPTYSTTLWEAQEIVRGEHDLALPGDLPPNTYRLSLTLLPDTNTPAGVSYLGTVRVEKPGK